LNTKADKGMSTIKLRYSDGETKGDVQTLATRAPVGAWARNKVKLLIQCAV
jgi:hypothetical protein